MFCPQCGAPTADTHKFCTECGRPLTADEQPVESSGTQVAIGELARFWPRAFALAIDGLAVVLICALVRGLLQVPLAPIPFPPVPAPQL